VPSISSLTWRSRRNSLRCGQRVTSPSVQPRANVPEALTILKRAGIGRRPAKGDEMARPSRKRR
jgi:hypothetical protein